MVRWLDSQSRGSGSNPDRTIKFSKRGIKMGKSLHKVLKELNEEKDDNVVDAVMELFDAAMFDEDGEFVGWEESAYRQYGKKRIEKNKETLKKYLEKHGVYDESLMYYIIFSAGEGEVETKKDLDDTVKIVKQEMG